MKLFVWEDVLTDWSEGIICVYAENELQARQLLLEKDNLAAKRVENITPKVITKPEAFVVWGGG